MSPTLAEKISLLSQINERTYVEVIEVLVPDALDAEPQGVLIERVVDFVGHKGERRAVKFMLPLAQAERVFDLALQSGRTYQDVLELLLGQALSEYPMEALLEWVDAGQGRLEIAV